MNKWFRRAVGTVGIAGGALLLGTGTAQADDSVTAVKDPQLLQGLAEDLVPPSGEVTDPDIAPHQDGRPRDSYTGARLPDMFRALPISSAIPMNGLGMPDSGLSSATGGLTNSTGGLTGGTGGLTQTTGSFAPEGVGIHSPHAQPDSGTLDLPNNNELALPLGGLPQLAGTQGTAGALNTAAAPGPAFTPGGPGSPSASSGGTRAVKGAATSVLNNGTVVVLPPSGPGREALDTVEALPLPETTALPSTEGLPLLGGLTSGQIPAVGGLASNPGIAGLTSGGVGNLTNGGGVTDLTNGQSVSGLNNPLPGTGNVRDSKVYVPRHAAPSQAAPDRSTPRHAVSEPLQTAEALPVAGALPAVPSAVPGVPTPDGLFGGVPSSGLPIFDSLVRQSASTNALPRQPTAQGGRGGPASPAASGQASWR